jgi:hypothetical protein
VVGRLLARRLPLVQFLSHLDDLFLEFPFLFQKSLHGRRLDRAGHPNLHLKQVNPLQLALVTLIAIVVQGILSSYRAVWWRFIFWLATQHPTKYVAGIMNSIVGHHFIRYTAELLDNERAQRGGRVVVGEYKGPASAAAAMK